MSELDKIAKQIKVAKKAYDVAHQRLTRLQEAVELARKAVNASALNVSALRSKLARVAEGAEPNSAIYV